MPESIPINSLHSLLDLRQPPLGVLLRRRFGFQSLRLVIAFTIGAVHLPQADRQPGQQHHCHQPAGQQHHPPALALLQGAHQYPFALQLGLAGAVLGRLPDAPHFRRHYTAVGRPIVLPKRQAALAKRRQLGLGAALVQAGQGIGHLAPHRLQPDLIRRLAPIRRLAGQDLAQDRSHAEDVAARIDQANLSARLFGGGM